MQHENEAKAMKMRLLMTNRQALINRSILAIQKVLKYVLILD